MPSWKRLGSSSGLERIAIRVGQLPLVGRHAQRLIEGLGSPRKHLPLQEFARELDVSVSTVERWIRQGRIPVRCETGICEYDPRELDAWLESNRLRSSTEREEPTESSTLSLVECIERGGVHALSEIATIERILAECAERVPVRDHGALLDALLERESLASTGIGHGVAVPHARAPLGTLVTEPLIGVFYPARAVDFRAVDGKPVFVIFLLVSPTVKTHLRMLSRLAFCLKNDTFLAFLAARPRRESLLRQLRGLEDDLEKGNAESL